MKLTCNYLPSIPPTTAWPGRAIVGSELHLSSPLSAIDKHDGKYLGQPMRSVHWLHTQPQVELLQLAKGREPVAANGWAETWPVIVEHLSLVWVRGMLVKPFVAEERDYLRRELARDAVRSIWHTMQTVPLPDGRPLGNWNAIVTLYRARKLAHVRAWMDWITWPDGLTITDLTACIHNVTGERIRVEVVDGRWKGQGVAPAGDGAGYRTVSLIKKTGDPPGVRNATEFARMAHLQSSMGLTTPYSTAQKQWAAANRTAFTSTLDAGNLANLDSAMKESFASTAISTEFCVLGREADDRMGYAALSDEQIRRLCAVPAYYTTPRVLTPTEQALSTLLKRHTIEATHQPPLCTHPTLVVDQEGPDNLGRVMTPLYRFGNVLMHYWPSQIVEWAWYTQDPELLALARRVADEWLNCWWRHTGAMSRGYCRRANYPCMGSQNKFLEDPSILYLAWRYFDDWRAKAAWLEYWQRVGSGPQTEWEFRAPQQSVCSMLIALESESLPAETRAAVEAECRRIVSWCCGRPYDPERHGPRQFWDARWPLLIGTARKYLGDAWADVMETWTLAFSDHPGRDEGFGPTHRLSVNLWRYRRDGGANWITQLDGAVERLCARTDRLHHEFFMSQIWGIWPHFAAAVGGS